MRLERISPATETAALAYLSGSPYENVFISYLVLFDRASATRNNVFVAMDGNRVRGVTYFGRQLVLASDVEALDAFAERAVRYHGERTIVGPRETVRGFWDRLQNRHARPRIVRDRQLVMMIDRRRLRRLDSPVRVRHARLDEWAAVADSSAQMIEQELACDPRRASPEFVANVRQMIESDRWWVGESGERLCFFCNVGPWCHKTAQLQGVWTPPELRGRGLATAALSAVCDELLDAASPTLSLYVNDFNTGAIALYRRVGFEHVSDFQTLLF
ncbi:MAG TPA: GNAT family N-acetyltransferase [Candidatus Tumulicola sp.]